jgi:hypothetical protein
MVAIQRFIAEAPDRIGVFLSVTDEGLGICWEDR